MEKSKENCNHIAIFVQENSESSRTLEEYLSRKIEKVSLFVLNEIDIKKKQGIIYIYSKNSLCRLDSIDKAIFRIWGDYSSYIKLRKYIKILAKENIKFLNSLEGINNSQNKKKMISLFEKNKIFHPETIFLDKLRYGDIQSYIKRNLWKKIVIKGKYGNIIEFINTEDFKDKKYNKSSDYIMQKYVENKNQKGFSYHYRAIVINAKICVLMKFTSQDKKQLASNISLGGEANLEEIAKVLTEENKKELIKASKAIELVISGVDFFLIGKKVLVIEVNHSPGLYTAYQLGTSIHFQEILKLI